jgi:putative SOS response-associated peptidase YedK
MQWGLIPHWTADPSIANRLINARAETLTDLPSFKNIVDRRRCIIPADGFYEWRKEGKRKVPMWVHLKTREPFAFAGFVGRMTQAKWEAVDENADSLPVSVAFVFGCNYCAFQC